MHDYLSQITPLTNERVFRLARNMHSRGFEHWRVRRWAAQFLPQSLLFCALTTAWCISWIANFCGPRTIRASKVPCHNFPCNFGSLSGLPPWSQEKDRVDSLPWTCLIRFIRGGMERPHTEKGCAVSFLCRHTTGVDAHWKHWSVFGALASPLQSMTLNFPKGWVEGLRALTLSHVDIFDTCMC